MAILSYCLYAAFGMQDERFQEGDVVRDNGGMITSVNNFCLKDFVFQSSVSKSHIGIIEKFEFVEKGNVEAHVRWERCEIPQEKLITEEFRNQLDVQIASMKELVQPLSDARCDLYWAEKKFNGMGDNVKKLRKQLESAKFRRANFNPEKFTEESVKKAEERVKEEEKKHEDAQKLAESRAATFSELEKKVKSCGAFHKLENLLLRIKGLPTTKYIQETKPHPLGDLCKLTMLKKLTKAHELQMNGRTKTERLVQQWTNRVERLKGLINPDYRPQDHYISKGVLRHCKIYEDKVGTVELVRLASRSNPSFYAGQKIHVEFHGLTKEEKKLHNENTELYVGEFRGPRFYEKERVWPINGDTLTVDADSHKCLADLQVLNDLKTES